MKIYLQVHRETCVFPATETPVWAPMVERWYQLDAPAYSFAQTYTQLKSKLGVAPDLVIVASPRASNATDRAFATSGASSPSKFVHTLPNIRAVSLLQVMNWHGPLLCLQDDPFTIRSGIDQALAHFESDAKQRSAWVISYNDTNLETAFFVLTRDPLGSVLLERHTTALTPAGGADQHWLDWVCNGAPSRFNLTDRYQASLSPTFISGA